jgi:hypothetical protein
MLDLNAGGVSTNCNGTSRRDFLRVGGLSALGLTLANFFRAQAIASDHPPVPAQRRNVNCILMWMQGGPSHIDTLDPKPDAPAEIRGEFGTIPTRIPGCRIVEHFPLLADQFDKLSLIRGHDPQNGSHGVADHIMMSGHRFNPALPFPCFGSVVAKERGYRDNMFPFVQLGRNIDRRFNGGVGGFLGDQYNPFEVHDDPSTATFRVRDLSIASEDERRRLERRHSWLQEVDRYQREMEANQSVQARDAFYERAHTLITSPAAKNAFDLGREPDRVRDMYGRNALGQQCLLARRLIERTRLCCKTCTCAACSKTHWSSGSATSAARRSSIRRPGAITGPRLALRPWAAAAFAWARSLARPMREPKSSSIRRCVRKTWRRRSITRSAFRSTPGIALRTGDRSNLCRRGGRFAN